MHVLRGRSPRDQLRTAASVRMQNTTSSCTVGEEGPPTKVTTAAMASCRSMTALSHQIHLRTRTL